MPYYPDTSVIKGLARIRRERKLPPIVVPQETHTLAGMQV